MEVNFSDLKPLSDEQLPAIDIPRLVTSLEASQPLIPAVRQVLDDFKEECHRLFLESLDAESLVRHRSNQFDKILAFLWQHTLSKDTEANTDGLLLAAVGGYGRGELHPHSDIDLLLLALDEDSINRNSGLLQDFITLLWDLKLDVGHSVRTLEECVTEARNDLTIITNLIESRCLVGDQQLMQNLHQRVAADKLWPAGQFFSEKFEEFEARHRKHDDPEYNLEPNVKNSPGTLRDIQTVAWVTRRYFDQARLENLLDLGFFTEYEFRRLDTARRFLWTLRYALHMTSGREEDRLLFDLQPKIAEILGFVDDDQRPAVEHFMSAFYRNQLTIREMCDLLMTHFKTDYVDAECPDRITAINQHFCLRNNYLSLETPDLFQQDPSWLLRIFLVMAKTPKVSGMTAATIRALIDNRHLVDESFRTNPDNHKIFLQLLQNKSCVVRELTRMSRYSVLGRYIPEFGAITGMMEYDLLHKYTVDDHALRMVRLLRHFRFGDIRRRFPLASQLILKVNKIEVLYLTALLHDTGKAEPGDHTINGEKITRRVCQRLGLAEKDTEMVAWLVANHLLMSHASQRIDLNDPEEIHGFAQEVGTPERLQLLFLVSAADTFSTNPDLWTPWRAEQMRDLYWNTFEAFQRGLDDPISRQDYVTEIQTEALQRLQQQGIDNEQALQIWGRPGDEYFIREGVDNVIWQTLKIEQHGSSQKPLIEIRQTCDEDHVGATEIFIFMKDQPDLFAVTTATLDQLDLNIQDARIMISEEENNAVDTYSVLDNDNHFISDQQRLNEIRQHLMDALSDPDHFTTIINRRTPRALKQFEVKTKVILSNDAIAGRTVVEVSAADRPGLLAKVGQILSAEKAQILGAKIMTEGERVSDIFYIVDREGRPFADVDLCQQLQSRLESGLDEQVKAQSAV